MTVRRKTSQVFTMLMLILLMSMACVVPSGQHFELCFGEDGHVDVSVDSCYDRPMPSQQNVTAAGQAHHETCLDVPFACNSSEQLLCPDEKTGDRTFREKNTAAAAGFFPAAIPRSPPAGASSTLAAHLPVLPPFHLVFLKIVALLFYS